MDSSVLHPVVTRVLDTLGENRGELVFSEQAIAEAKVALSDEKGKLDPQPFVELLVAWHKLHEARVEPAATQLLPLVRLFSDRVSATAGDKVLAKAADALKNLGTGSAKAVSLPQTKVLGVGMRKK